MSTYNDGYHDASAHWQYALSQHVRWCGATVIIVSRRWVERHALPPYAEYQVQYPGERWGL